MRALWALPLAIFIAVAPTRAQTVPGTTTGPGAGIVTHVSIGFSGRARMGAWTPVWITVEAPPDGIDGTLTIAATASSGTTVVRYAVPVRAGPGARVTVFLPAVFYDARAPGTLHLDDTRGGGRLASLVLPRLRPIDDIVLVLSSEPIGVEAAISGEIPAAAAAERLEIAYLAPENLPATWHTYEAVRLLVVRTLDERRVDDAQRLAIRNWVWSGGRVLAMPAGDDIRHLRDATLRDLLPGRALSVTTDPQAPVAVIRPRPGSETPVSDGLRVLRWRTGRGAVVLWDRDAAEQSRRGNAGVRHAWRALLADRPTAHVADLESTLAAHRPVPVRTHVLIGGFVLVYLVVAAKIGRLFARWRAATALLAAAGIIVATVAALQAALVARREASGVLAASVVEALPGTGHGVLSMLGRTVLSHDGGFVVKASGNILLRPVPPSAVTIIQGEGVAVQGTERSVRLSGSGVVPVGIVGTLTRRADGMAVAVTNLSSAPVRQPWIYDAGRVQAISDISSEAHITLDERRWQTRDRLQRTEPNHALLVWAFSQLETDAILKATPTWLVGWWHDPALGLRWGDRQESAQHLVLVPLTAP